MRLKLILLVLMIGNPLLAQAAGTIATTFPTYFRTIDSSTATYPVFYAGATAKACSGAKDSITPCNSCPSIASFSDGMCSEFQIYKELYFTITINSSETTIINSSEVVMSDGTTHLAGTLVSGTMGPGVDLQVRWTWSQICGAFGGSADCLYSFSKSLKVGFTDGSVNDEYLGEYSKFKLRYRYVSGAPLAKWCPLTGGDAFAEPDSGVCYFTVYPGDEKVFLETQHWDSELATDCSSKTKVFKVPKLDNTATPSAYDTTDMKYTTLRVYYEKGSAYTAVTPQSAYKDISISSCDLKTDAIDGLDNDTDYVFNIANVDQAGIISYFGDTSRFAAADFTDPNLYGKVQSARPQQVFGLLQDKKCFIATASFGSPMAGEVQSLRLFRNQFLLPNSLGKWVVDTYYRLSPPAADFIAKHESLRSGVRALLWPFIIFARLALHFGLLMSLGIFGLASALVIFAVNRVGRKMRRSV